MRFGTLNTLVLETSTSLWVRFVEDGCLGVSKRINRVFGLNFLRALNAYNFENRILNAYNFENIPRT